MKIFNKIKKFFIYHFWWINEFKIQKVKSPWGEGRCINCDAGNYKNEKGERTILCDGENKKCPCKWDEQLKFRKNEK